MQNSIDDVIADALRSLKQGRAHEALASLSTLANPNETVWRTLAVVHASQASWLAASVSIEKALASPEQDVPALATLAVAARIAEDRAQFALAFSRYEALIAREATQFAYWRGLWRAAQLADDPHLRQRALALTAERQIDVTDDPALALVVARAMREGVATAEQLRAWLHRLDAVRQVHTTDPHVVADWLAALNDTVPSFCTPDALATTHRDAVRLAGECLARTDRFAALGRLLASMTKLPALFANERDIDAARARYELALHEVERAFESNLAPEHALSAFDHTAFRLAYMGRDDLALQRQRGDLLARIVSAAVIELPARNLSKDETTSRSRIRVGIVSKHLRDCTVGHYFVRLLTDLPRDQFEVFTYACGNADALTAQFEARADRAARFPLRAGDDVRLATLSQIAQVIARDTPDLLVYPEVGMEPLIERLAALRLARVQCALWGHPDTTGLPTIDAFFSADAIEPGAAQRHYRERLICLPGLGCCYPRPPRLAAQTLSRRALGLPEGLPLLVCAQSSFKWNVAFIDAVARILGANPSAKLVFFRNREPVAAVAFEAYLDERLAKHGIDRSARTIELCEASRERFLEVLSTCDLALDTFDFSGGNTSLDSLSVGLPVLTLPGAFMRGRQTFAMLERLGIEAASSLIARSVDDYVQRANALLADRSRLGTLSASVRANAEALFNDATPSQAFAARLHELATDNKIAERRVLLGLRSD